MSHPSLCNRIVKYPRNVYLVLLHGDELALNVGDVNKVLLSALLAPDVAVAPRSTEVADCSFLGGALETEERLQVFL